MIDCESSTYTNTKDIHFDLKDRLRKAREKEQAHCRLLVKAALQMLKEYKHADIELYNINDNFAPWDDPLNLRTNIVIQLVDKDALDRNFRSQYSSFGYKPPEMARFVMMLTPEDTDEHYGPYDYENKLPREIHGPTLVAMRIATKIYWAWQHNVYGRDPVKQGI